MVSDAPSIVKGKRRRGFGKAVLNQRVKAMSHEKPADAEKDLSEIIGAVEQRLEYYAWAGIDSVPAPKDYWGVWPLGPLVFVERAGLSGKGHFTREHGDQLEKIGTWMAGELGLDGFSIKDGWIGPVRGTGPDSLRERILASSPKVIVALGDGAASALAPHVCGLNGTDVVQTHGPGEVLEDAAAKKKVHLDMLRVLRRLK